MADQIGQVLRNALQKGLTDPTTGKANKGWSINESANHIRLRVRKTDKGETKTWSQNLPLAWCMGSAVELQALIREMKRFADDGGHTISDCYEKALPVLSGLAGFSTQQTVNAIEIDWKKIIDDHKRNRQSPDTLFGRPISAKTAAVEETYFNFVENQLTGRKGDKVTDIEKLLINIQSEWSDSNEARKKAVQAVNRLMKYAIKVHDIDNRWLPDSFDNKRVIGDQPKRKHMATFSDDDLIRLINSLEGRWKNLVIMIAIYGLRPHEYKKAEPREYPGQLIAAYINYRKPCGPSFTEPGIALPLFPVDKNGKKHFVDFPERWAKGEIEFPEIKSRDGEGNALREHLTFNTVWMELKEKRNKSERGIASYVFRHLYSMRSEQLKIATADKALSMRHSLRTSQLMYETTSTDRARAAFAQAQGL